MLGELLVEVPQHVVEYAKLTGEQEVDARPGDDGGAGQPAEDTAVQDRREQEPGEGGQEDAAGEPEPQRTENI